MKADRPSAQLHHSIVHLAGDPETFARRLFQTGSVDNREFPAVVFNEISLLQNASREIHALPADAEHVGQKFLSQPEAIFTFAISGFEQPTAHALFNCVMLNTRSVLRTALDEHQGVSHQELG